MAARFRGGSAVTVLSTSILCQALSIHCVGGTLRAEVGGRQSPELQAAEPCKKFFRESTRVRVLHVLHCLGFSRGRLGPPKCKPADCQEVPPPPLEPRSGATAGGALDEKGRTLCCFLWQLAMRDSAVPLRGGLGGASRAVACGPCAHCPREARGPGPPGLQL